MKYVGIDGCAAGWAAVVLTLDGELAFKVFPRFATAGEAYPEALILVDIPIGLRESGAAERLCDRAARAKLGRRASSVFAAPVRATLHAPDYGTASAINCEATRSDRAPGRRLSKQSFAILPKIREVDEYLSGQRSAGPTIREMHPELCFWGLNGGRPLSFNKKSREGRDERLLVLRSHLPTLAGLVGETVRAREYPGVAADDIVDAAVGAATAFLSRGDLHTLPSEPERDTSGLPMEMVYCLLQPRRGVTTAPGVPEPHRQIPSVAAPRPTRRNSSREARGTTRVGFTNRNQQTVIRPTGLPGTDHGQSIYVLRCGPCGYEYGANGSDIFQRRCPMCQGGAPGLAF